MRSCINLDNKLVANIISGLKAVTYIKLAIMLLYKMLSTFLPQSSFINFAIEASGVVIVLQPQLLYFLLSQVST